MKWLLFHLIPIPLALCCSSRSVLICSTAWDSTLTGAWDSIFTWDLGPGTRHIYLGPGSQHLSWTQYLSGTWDSTHIYLLFSFQAFANLEPGHLFRFGTYFLSTLVFLNLQSVKGSPNQSTTLISNKSPKNLERDFVCQYKVFLVLICSPS